MRLRGIYEYVQCIFHVIILDDCGYNCIKDNFGYTSNH